MGDLTRGNMQDDNEEEKDASDARESKYKEMGLKRNGFAKKSMRPKKKESDAQKNAAKVLTFVDMSHLTYLSRSVANESAFSQAKKKRKELPKNTQAAIIEDESEDSSGGEDDRKMASLALKKTES